MTTRVKICGITRVEDARELLRLGADAIGLVFYPRSARVLTVEAAVGIAQAVGPLVTTVGLFLDAEPAVVRAVVDAVPLNVLQFHGDEPQRQCSSFGLPYMKAVPVRQGFDSLEYARRYPDAAAYLLDSHELGAAGGTGHAFDWERIPDNLGKPVVLAGGLAPGNVAAAIARTRPYAVDVSSGVEHEKGVKDWAKMAAFMHEVSRVDNE